MATVGLEYLFDLGLQNPSNYVARVSAINVFDGPTGANILSILGMTVISDVTAVVGSTLKRIFLLSTTALGDQLYPNATALKNATRGIFRAALELRTSAGVTATEPGVT